MQGVSGPGGARTGSSGGRRCTIPTENRAGALQRKVFGESKMEVRYIMRQEKEIVRSFYDSFGWRKEATGRYYNDTAVFTDTRPVSRWYQHKIHMRIAQFFGRGKYFLDAGSGAIPHSEYLVYSSGYRRRVCVDISETALKEARSKIQDKGFYVVADLVHLPFQEGIFDAAISAHVLYHVPRDEQGAVLSELYRTLRHPGVCVVVYSQFAGPLDYVPSVVRRILALPRRIVRARNFRQDRPVDESGPARSDGVPPLYAYTHNRKWFQETLPGEWDVDIRCWSIVDQYFSRRFVPNGLFGRCILGLIYLLETAFPHALAWTGYQTIVIRK